MAQKDMVHGLLLSRSTMLTLPLQVFFILLGIEFETTFTKAP
jgi:hypothetical protein